MGGVLEKFLWGSLIFGKVTIWNAASLIGVSSFAGTSQRFWKVSKQLHFKFWILGTSIFKENLWLLPYCINFWLHCLVCYTFSDFCSPWNGFLMISGEMGVGWFGRIGLVFEAKFEDVLLEIVHLVSTQNFLWEWHFVLPPDDVKLTVRVWEWEMLLLGGFCWRAKWMAPK